MNTQSDSPPLSEIEIRYLKGVGPKLSERLAKLGIHTAQDVLFHLPLRYEDRSKITSINQLKPGQAALVEVEILQTEVLRRRRMNLICQVRDPTGRLSLRFFHFSNAQRQRLLAGSRLRCYGEVRLTSLGLEMVHPEYQVFAGSQSPPLEQALTPVYPTTERVSQSFWRQLTDQVLEVFDYPHPNPPPQAGEGAKRNNPYPQAGEGAPFLSPSPWKGEGWGGGGLTELLPKPICRELNLPSLHEALIFVHRPPVGTDVAELLNGQHPCVQRLAFEELLAHQLSLRHLRAALQKHQAVQLPHSKTFQKQLIEALPFQLTKAQERVTQEINADLQKPYPMLRLVQGDVGSGKTIVAALAALQAIEQGYQVAVMAPTELLAEQHFKNFTQWLEPLGIQLAWLTSQVKGKTRAQTLETIQTGKAQLMIGTHALFQKEVEFKKLALVIIDEQHRFGVHQRLALKEKGIADGFAPHQLIMTATPIPRTLAMSAYADLDQSIIDELPPGRKPVATIVVDNQRRLEVVERIRVACEQGRQVYWVCTLIEESEKLQCQAAEQAYLELQQQLSGLGVALVHGRMKASEKEQIMAAFKTGETDLLVATTVIEVGVDVPNASLMVIDNAERLGLSQLHQLRGRVGRGSAASHCVLLYQTPLSQNGRERLAIMKETNDGFQVAQKDLELRGPGEVLGTKQTGEVDFRIADLLRDQHLLPKIQQVANELFKQHPHLIQPIIQRWIGQAGRYGRV